MKSVGIVEKNLMIVLFASALWLIFVAGVFAQDGKVSYGQFQGNLSELAPQSIKMNYNVNDPPGTFANYDTGYFDYKVFDIDPERRSVRGNIQLDINATKWTKSLPGRKNYDYQETRTDHTGGYSIRAKVTAGNIDLDASLSVGGTLVNSPKVPDVKALLHEMLKKIPQKAL